MHYTFDWSVIYSYRGILVAGLLSTLLVSALSFVVSLVGGTLVALGRVFLPRWIAWVCTALTEVFRNIPPIVQFFFWYFAVGLNGLPAAVVGLSAYTASHFAEVIRSGIGGIPRTQLEAARSSGLTQVQAIRWVLLPQAFVRTLPPISSEIVNIIKNSSIAMTIGYTELSYQTSEIEAETFRGFEAATASTVIYALVGLSVLTLMHGIEKAIRRDLKMSRT